MSQTFPLQRQSDSRQITYHILDLRYLPSSSCKSPRVHNKELNRNTERVNGRMNSLVIDDAISTPKPKDHNFGYCQRS